MIGPTVDALIATLPPTALDPNGLWVRRELAAIAALLDDAANSDGRLYNEQDPALTAELLEDWERNYGLPDQCTPLGGTIAERVAQLLRKIASTGGQNAAYMIAVAAQLGASITITEFDPHTVDDAVDAPLYDDTVRFVWQVNLATPGLIDFSVDSAVDEPLQSGVSINVECVLNEIKPAHTQLIMNYF